VDSSEWRAPDSGPDRRSFDAGSSSSAANAGKDSAPRGDRARGTDARLPVARILDGSAHSLGELGLARCECGAGGEVLAEDGQVGEDGREPGGRRLDDDLREVLVAGIGGGTRPLRGTSRATPVGAQIQSKETCVAPDRLWTPMWRRNPRRRSSEM
jgi:hypothetical protein